MASGFCVVCGQQSRELSDTGLCPNCDRGEPDATRPVEVATRPVEVTASVSVPSGDGVARVWEPGDVLQDTYEVRGVLGEGGFGTVYRVHHRGWGLDLAVKSPKPGVEGFEAEAEAWVELGLHPHIVTCHYVRSLGGVPRVFAELVAGGSLHDWIRDGRLYDGAEAEVLRRILDVAIQFGWGLGYAHERGLVHQDVKPANVLVTSDGMVKVTDFGLVHAKAPAGIDGVDGGSVVVEAGAYTPGYASPEQHAGERLSRRTDVWSWAVSVLEMFWGDRTWQHGWEVPPLLVEQCVSSGPLVEGPPAMPEPVAKLLRDCLQRDPQARPHNFDHISQRLIEICQQATGGPYSREQPQAAELLADQLNNKALSLLDLGREEEADTLFDQALVSDPHHLEATYNRGLRQWRRGEITDLDLVTQLEEVRRSHEGTWRDEYLLALIHIERGHSDSARALLEAAREHTNAPEVAAALTTLDRDGDRWCTLLGALKGHTREVKDVAVSPDGRRVVSGSDDKSVRVWDVGSGKCVRILEGHTAGVTGVAVSPDGRRVVSGSDDESVRVWDVGSGKCVRILEGHTGGVLGVAVFADGCRVVSGGLDGLVRVWDVESGVCVRSLEGHADRVESVAVFADGCRVASASWDQSVRVWEVGSGECVQALEGHTGWVFAVAVALGRQLHSGGRDGVRVWDVESGICARTLEGHTQGVKAVALCPDGQTVVSASKDGTVRVWDVGSGECLRTLEGHGGAVLAVDVFADGRRVVSGGSDGTVRVWDVGFGEKGVAALSRPQTAGAVLQQADKVRSALDHATQAVEQGQYASALNHVREARRVHGFERNPDLLDMMNSAGRHGRRVALGQAWIHQMVEVHAGSVSTFAVFPDGRQVVSGGSDGTVRVWDVGAGECMQTLEGHAGRVAAVAVSLDGRQLFSGGRDGVRVWDAGTGQCVGTLQGHELQGHSVTVTSIAVFSDGCRVVSAGLDGTVRVWDAGTGECLSSLDDQSGAVYAVAVSLDGRQLFSGGRDGVRVWDVGSGECLRILEGHTDRVESVAVFPDGCRVASASWDDPVRVWDVGSGECLRILEGHTDRVESVAVFPDGRWVVSGGLDGTVRVWDVASGECVRTLEGSAAALSLDGRWVVSRGMTNALLVWELDWQYKLPEPMDWDEGARQYLDTFLALHIRSAPIESSIREAPSWSEEDFRQLLTELGWRGFGWLRPDGIRAKLEELAAGREAHKT